MLGEGAIVNELFFLQRIQIYKKKIWGGGVGAGG